MSSSHHEDACPMEPERREAINAFALWNTKAFQGLSSTVVRTAFFIFPFSFLLFQIFNSSTCSLAYTLRTSRVACSAGKYRPAPSTVYDQPKKGFDSRHFTNLGTGTIRILSSLLERSHPKSLSPLFRNVFSRTLPIICITRRTHYLPYNKVVSRFVELESMVDRFLVQRYFRM
ncbi:hypothetical protein DFJ58DRAFT_47331 [Suillus subalutaceus]|uniref:uncharacterized protein n=1 Tax=Suillus subalutaceus TaxID=48586 RepID=UPI001B874EC3|nr:uncharacterized protein DFJ58DRAFT_47331 [Suillus subalutaceus]KAG1843139.1 hypothetical protein DFJ58DRAFT_47331 [Suillus subalutaceus]